MTEAEELILTQALARGRVIWTPDESTARQVIRICNPAPPKGEEPEPSKCAYFADGKYAALYAAELQDFYHIQPITTTKQEN